MNKAETILEELDLLEFNTYHNFTILNTPENQDALNIQETPDEFIDGDKENSKFITYNTADCKIKFHNESMLGDLGTTPNPAMGVISAPYHSTIDNNTDYINAIVRRAKKRREKKLRGLT